MSDSEALQKALTMAEDWKKKWEKSNKQNMELQAQIQTLLSDKQKLSEALKQRNNDMQTLNEQVVKLKGADKVIQENNQLKRLNNQLTHSIQSTKVEAEESKREAQDSLRSSQEARRALLAKSRSIDQLINQKASEKTRETRNKLKTNYQDMTNKTKALLAVPTVYSLVLTLVLVLRLPHIWLDLGHVFRDIGWFIWKPTTWLFHFTNGWRGWLHWLLSGILLILLVIIVLGVVIALITTFSTKAWQVFPDVVVLLGLVALILVFGPLLQHFLPWINLAWLLLSAVGGYSVIAGIKQRQKF